MESKTTSLEIEVLSVDENNQLKGGYVSTGGSDPMGNLVMNGNCTFAGDSNTNCVCPKCLTIPPIEDNKDALKGCKG